MNAYEDEDTIVLDLVRHPKMLDTDLDGPNEGPHCRGNGAVRGFG